MLLHLVDGTAQDPAQDWRTIVHELEEYGHALAARPRLTVLNKVDALEPEARAEARAALAVASGGPVMEMSGVSGEGVPAVLRALRAQIEAARAPLETEPEPWRP